MMHDGRRLSEILTEFCTRRENFAQIDTFEERGEEKLHFPQDSIRLMLEMGKVDLLAGIYFKIGCVTFLLAVLKDTRPTIYVMILSVTQGSGSEFRPITRPDSESRLPRLRPYQTALEPGGVKPISYHTRRNRCRCLTVEWKCAVFPLSLQFHADQCQFWIWRRRKEAIYCHSKQIACREAENGVGEKTRKRNACIAMTSADKEICAVLV